MYSVLTILINENYILLSSIHPIKASVDSHNIEDDFDHLVAHVMSCTLESGVGCAMGNRMLRFRSLDEVINVDDLEFFDKGYGLLKIGIEMYIDQCKARGISCMNKATPRHKDKTPKDLTRRGQVGSLDRAKNNLKLTPHFLCGKLVSF